MQTSERGRKLIETFEGLRLKAYRDAVDVWTVGYGHTSASGNPEVIPGLTITKDTADQILTADLAKFEAGVLRAIKRPMEQGQFDAMVSLAFNIGIGAFRSSSVARYFNRGQMLMAANAFQLWARAGGRVLPALVRRRAAERQMFLFQGSEGLADKPSETNAHRIDNPHGLLQRWAARVELELAGTWA